jgi:hypothetical protein
MILLIFAVADSGVYSVGALSDESVLQLSTAPTVAMRTLFLGGEMQTNWEIGKSLERGCRDQNITKTWESSALFLIRSIILILGDFHGAAWISSA